MMAKKFDLVVIGTGAAGSTAAYKCRQAGWSVAIIDVNPFGGTCALRGCDPKKVLVGVAELIDWNQRMLDKGIFDGRGPKINWSALMDFKKTFTELVPENRAEGFRKAGIVAFRGRAKFIGENTLKVGEEVLAAKYILIGAGARPITLNIPGEEYLINSTQFLELENLPRKIIFVGGGYISFEFAHVAARAGAEVIILHRGARPLEGFDTDLVQYLVAASRHAGIDLSLETAVEAIERDGDNFSVQTSTKSGRKTFEAKLVVHGAGRVPDIEDLDLEKGGVKREKKGIVVNEYLQSVSNAAVYAAGDAALSSGLPLTPVAAMEGAVAASNLLQGNHLKPDYTGTPTVAFTIPPLASVGLSEKLAKEKGLRFRVNQEDTSGWYSSKRIGIKHSAFKVLIEEETNRILGAHLLGPAAEEVINLFAVAIRFNLRASDLKKIAYAYPTSASDIVYML